MSSIVPSLSLSIRGNSLNASTTLDALSVTVIATLEVMRNELHRVSKKHPLILLAIS